MCKELPIYVNDKFSYNISISFNFEKFTENLIKIKSDKACKICIVTDSNVVNLYANEIKGLLLKFYNDVLIYSIPAGEQNKTLETIGGLYEYLINTNFERKDLLIALGGGVIGDMTGFAAATYLRGIDYIQIPTTLLAQVDSSIGGKTAVDYLKYKNMVGAFYYPKLVYINLSVLKTLDYTQFACGMGEVIKYGLISDVKFYEWLRDNASSVNAKNEEALLHIVYESCKCKKLVVEEDPTEKELRAILNFGHTIGHAIESLSDFSLYHGQCVSIGMMAALYIAVRKGMIEEKWIDDISDLLCKYGLPVNVRNMDVDRILNATKSDKKMQGGTIKFILLERIGKAIISQSVNDDDLRYGISRVVV